MATLVQTSKTQGSNMTQLYKFSLQFRDPSCVHLRNDSDIFYYINMIIIQIHTY
jgi:hypothetical protein